MSTMSITALEILEQSEMPSTHARAIAKAIEADFLHRLDNLATKSDLARLEATTKTDLAKLEGNLRVEIRDVKSDVVRWVFLAVMGQTALFSGIMYFLLRVMLSS